LSSWLDTGVEKLETADTCTFIAAKCSRDPDCKRHGSEFPALVRAGGGHCPVRAEVYTPREVSDGGKVRVIVFMRGTHSHVVPVCKPRSAVVHKVVEENPSQSIRTLQVCKSFIGVSFVFCAEGGLVCCFFLNVKLY